MSMVRSEFTDGPSVGLIEFIEELREDDTPPEVVEIVKGVPLYELCARELPEDGQTVVLLGGETQRGKRYAEVRIYGSLGLLNTLEATIKPLDTFMHPYASIYSPSLSDKREL